MAIVQFHTDLPFHRPTVDETRASGPIDLHTHLVSRPTSTFFVFADGDAMRGVGIFSGDLMVVDRSRTAVHGDIVLVVHDSEFLVRQLEIVRGQYRFVVPSPPPSTTALSSADDLPVTIWGVVTSSVRYLRPNTAQSYRAFSQ